MFWQHHLNDTKKSPHLQTFNFINGGRKLPTFGDSSIH